MYDFLVRINDDTRELVSRGQPLTPEDRQTWIDLLNAAVYRLPPGQRNIILSLYHCKGYEESSVEISEIEGSKISGDALRQRASRARKNLKTIFKKLYAKEKRKQARQTRN